MKILVDHGSYEHRNMGDLAMLVASVQRLQRYAPTADICVITVDPQMLATVLPDVRPVAISRLPTILPTPIRRRLRIKWKKRAKWLSSHGVRGLPIRPAEYSSPRLASLASAIDDSDVVIAAGGGYVNDIFGGLGRGVLHTLARAQKLGKRTAMLGQGVGPINSRRTFNLAQQVLRNVDVLTVREGIAAPGILSRMGVNASEFEVTGDEALILAQEEIERRLATGRTSEECQGLGVNLRLAEYAGVAADVFEPIQAAIEEFLTWAGRPSVIAMPILSSAEENDIDPIRRCLPESAIGVVSPINEPQEIGGRAALCRALITGSYHAAVFGLALGVPVVAVSNSKYYDWKFGGLREFYGSELVRIIHSGGEEFPRLLSAGLRQAWDVGADVRREGMLTSKQLIASQEKAYRKIVEF